jgi:adenylate kinase
MSKRVILITGTPCVGKTSVAQLLSSELGAFYTNLTELAEKEHLISGKDEQRDSLIVDEARMRRKIREIIKNRDEDVVIDGHYAVSVVPERLVTHLFVLRRNPVELKKAMEQRGFSGNKLWENLASEILDVCLIDALSVHEKEKICEVNASGKSADEVVMEILGILGGHGKCRVGIVDWLGMLETEGLLDEYLKM